MLNNTQVHATYQEDSDKCSHLSDPYTSLHLDKAATNNHLHSENRPFLQNKGRDINKLCLIKQEIQWEHVFVKIWSNCCCFIKKMLANPYIFYIHLNKHPVFIFYLFPQPHGGS